MTSRDLGVLITRYLDSAISMGKTHAHVCHVAVDGSGAVEGQRFVALGYASGFEGNITPFTEAWLKLLDKYELHSLRMSEAYSFRFAFEEKHRAWGDRREEVRDELVLEAAKVIKTHLRPGGVFGRFDKTSKEKTISWRKGLLFHHMVLRNLREQPDNVTLAFMCDDEPDIAIDFYKHLTSFERKNEGWRRRIAGICFMDDRNVAHIQAADVVAYVLRDSADRVADGMPVSPLYPILFNQIKTVELELEFDKPPYGKLRPNP
jgi:hypothetical protein